MIRRKNYTRRKFLRTTAIMIPAVTLAACGSQSTVAPTSTNIPQPSNTVAPQPTATAAPPPATNTVSAAAPPATTAVRPTNTAAPTAVPTAAPTQPPVVAPTTVAASQAQLPPTPNCADADDVTIAQTEGPYFKPKSPERTSLLEAGIGGTKLVVTGYVLTKSCKPVPRALVDFWQADDKGVYDNTGFRMRGHQFTDANGRFTLETVVPGLYPGRTRHIHVKVQAPNQPVLTTQLYFPGEARNQGDSIYRPELLMKIQDNAGSKQGTFNFVVNMA